MATANYAPARHIEISSAAAGTPEGAESLFRSAGDCTAFLELLDQQVRENDLRLLAYCLLEDKIHLVIAGNEAAVNHALTVTFSLYEHHFNVQHKRTGALWKGRHEAKIIEGSLLGAMIACVENSPVRLNQVHSADEYVWSSARAHLGLDGDPALVMRGLHVDFLDMRWFRSQFSSKDWTKVLEETHVAEAIASATLDVPPPPRPARAPRGKAKATAAVHLH